MLASISATSAMFTRALRTDARRLRPHLFRMLFAGMILGSLVLAHVQSLSLGAPGLFFYSHILWLNLALILLAAVSFLSTAITEEKEEGTLGLLMLAGVTPMAMLLGKSITRQFSTLLLLVVQFPFALMAIVLGGVTLSQVFAGYAALAAFLALAANIGLLASVVCRRSGTAGGLTLLALLVLVGGGNLLRPIVWMVSLVWVRAAGIEESLPGLPVDWWGNQAAWFDDLGSVLPWTIWVGDCLDACDRLSILSRLSLIGGAGFDEPAMGAQVVLHLGSAMSLFGLSWLMFVPATRNALTGVPPRGLVSGSGRMGDAPKSVAGRSETRGTFGIRSVFEQAVGGSRWQRATRWLAAGRAWRLPLVWKEFYFTTGGVIWMLIKMVLYGVFVLSSGWLLFDPVSGWPLKAWCRIVVSGVVMLMAAEAAVQASRVFHDERKYRTLSVTLGFPVATWRVVCEKLGGCLLALFPGAVWLAIGIQLDESVYIELVTDHKVWIGVLVYIVFLHVVTLLSLYVRWGALPLSVAIMVVIGGCGYPLMWLPTVTLAAVTGSDEAMVMPTIYAACLAVAVLLSLTVLRLKTMASE